MKIVFDRSWLAGVGTLVVKTTCNLLESSGWRLGNPLNQVESSADPSSSDISLTAVALNKSRRGGKPLVFMSSTHRINNRSTAGETA